MSASTHADTIELVDVVRSIRRGWREIAVCLALGLVVAIAVIRWAPRRFDAPASLVIRDTDGSTSLLSRIGMPSNVGSIVGAPGQTSLETEIAILGSRALARQVIDSLHLTIYKRGKPLDHEDAVTYMLNHLGIEKAGGDVVRLVYHATDSLTAARVPNTLAAIYLERRKTTDRGVNAHRVEFLQRRIDSAAVALASAEDRLRREQETSGVIDPVTTGKLQLERAADLRGQLTALQTERGALDQLLAQVHSGRMSARELAAYPTFIKSSAISQLLTQLSSLEADRLKLLATRTEADPDVQAVSLSIKAVEGQLLPITESYASAVRSQQSELQHELDTLRAVALGMPRTAEANGRMQRDVLRLSQIYAALQAQLVDARLAEIGEGGDVRQLDVATVPKHPTFPKPVVTMGLGVGGGLLLGIFVALLMGGMGRWARDPLEVERATGLPALAFDPSNALLLAPAAAARTVLVLPLDARTPTDAVAQRLAETSTARAVQTTILDLSDHAGADVNGAIDNLEQEFGSVIVRLPQINTPTAAAALRENRPVILVATAPRVDKLALSNALGTLRRLEVPCAGIVLHTPDQRTRRLSV